MRTKLVVTYDDPETEVTVHFNQSPKQVRDFICAYDRKGWDHNSWCLVIDPLLGTTEEYHVQYDESMD